MMPHSTKIKEMTEETKKKGEDKERT